MDVTAIGIACGLAVGIGYVAVKALRQRSFDPGASFTVMLGTFSLPVAAVMVQAAFSGNISALPSTWREYLAASAVIGSGLAIATILKAFHAAWIKPVAADVKPSLPEVSSIRGAETESMNGLVVRENGKVSKSTPG